MKKFIFVLLTFFCFAGYSMAASITDQIKSGFEYVEINTDIPYISTPYKSNQNKVYYLMWSFLTYDVTEWMDLDSFKQKFGKDDLLFFLNAKTWEKFLIQKSKNLFPKSKCKQISDNSRILFEAYNDDVAINYANNIFGKDADTSQCYANKNTIFLPKYKNFVDDLNYFVENADAILTKVNNIKITYSGTNKNMSILKSIYAYVINGTDYNYDALQNSANYNVGYDYPRTAKWFFEWKKIVCGWYVEIFDLLSKLYGIKTQIELGSLQSLDKTAVETSLTWHAWISIWNLYFDPTLDDNWKEVLYNNFAKTKTCFNVSHYMTWWQKFDTVEQRFSYIKTNAGYLIYNCPQIVYGAVSTDNKTIDFMKYMLANFDLKTNQKGFCDIFNLCFEVNDKKALLSKLQNFYYKISDGTTTTRYNLRDELSKVSITDVVAKDYTDKSSYQISLFPDYKSKVEINNLMQKLRTLSKTKNEKELLNFYNKYKTQIFQLANSSKLSIEKRLKRVYFDSIFLVENLR